LITHGPVFLLCSIHNSPRTGFFFKDLETRFTKNVQIRSFPEENNGSIQGLEMEMEFPFYEPGNVGIADNIIRTQ
jgi:hypothetical protein